MWRVGPGRPHALCTREKNPATFEAQVMQRGSLASNKKTTFTTILIFWPFANVIIHCSACWSRPGAGHAMTSHRRKARCICVNIKHVNWDGPLGLPWFFLCKSVQGGLKSAIKTRLTIVSSVTHNTYFIYIYISFVFTMFSQISNLTTKLM